MTHREDTAISASEKSAELSRLLWELGGGNIPLVLECLEASAYGIITKGNGDVILTEEKYTSLSTGGGKPDKVIQRYF